MWWAMVAQAAQQAADSYLGAKGQARDYNLQLAKDFERTRWQNEETVRQNTLNLQNIMFNQGLMTMQEGLNKQQNIRNRLSLGIGETVDKAEVTLNQSAVGAVGASADAVLNDVTKKYDDANAELARQRQLETFQYDSGLQQAYTEYFQNIGSIDMSGFGVKLAKTNWKTHALGAGASTGMNYFMQTREQGASGKAQQTQTGKPNIQLESLKGRGNSMGGM